MDFVMQVTSEQPKNECAQLEEQTDGTGDTNGGHSLRKNSAEDDTMVAEMMSVDWKV